MGVYSTMTGDRDLKSALLKVFPHVQMMRETVTVMRSKYTHPLGQDNMYFFHKQNVAMNDHVNRYRTCSSNEGREKGDNDQRYHVRIVCVCVIQ